MKLSSATMRFGYAGIVRWLVEVTNTDYGALTLTSDPPMGSLLRCPLPLPTARNDPACPLPVLRVSAARERRGGRLRYIGN